MSDSLSSLLNSAEPASTRPATFGRSPEMKNCTAVSATCMAQELVVRFFPTLPLKACLMAHLIGVYQSLSSGFAEETASWAMPTLAGSDDAHCAITFSREGRLLPHPLHMWLRGFVMCIAARHSIVCLATPLHLHLSVKRRRVLASMQRTLRT